MKREEEEAAMRRRRRRRRWSSLRAKLPRSLSCLIPSLSILSSAGGGKGWWGEGIRSLQAYSASRSDSPT
ncbi:hypothetical protein E2C01_007547 [Portunus trituberculatus]|uniref:Uncharacterized protein n=1 Tax=Portunus trituberculatus TaxID=210409 RepID=A0A5B7CYG0_PORTR|nr:hypothetical protein [Portunus trituberculatus]